MITGDRSEFVGAHVTKSVKQNLKEEAKKRRISVSKLIYEWLQEKLKEIR